MDSDSRKPTGGGRRPQRRTSRGHGFAVLEDISAIAARSEDVKETLQRIVEVVATRVDRDPVLRGARIQLAARVREELLDTVASVSLA